MSLEEKKEFTKNNWNFYEMFIDQFTRELLLSNDGKYIFHCKFQLGNFEADKRNLNGSL